MQWNSLPHKLNSQKAMPDGQPKFYSRHKGSIPIYSRKYKRLGKRKFILQKLEGIAIIVCFKKNLPFVVSSNQGTNVILTAPNKNFVANNNGRTF